MPKNIGKKFNKLTILGIDEKKRKEQIDQNKKKIRKFYICECECGNICSIRADSVLNGHTKSCGCHKINTASLQGKKRLDDLTGQKFNKLTVIKRESDKCNHTRWLCLCDCGNKTIVYGYNLKSGHTTSCGCNSCSIGEYNIEQCLIKNNIKYAKEFTFNDLKAKHKLRFDFAIFDSSNNLIELIEFDGRQHSCIYTPWGSKETLEERQFRDNLKNEYCKKNNIKLVRIDYKYRDNITLKLLELEDLANE